MSLKSAGYDAVILLNERLLNQLSGALFYNGFLRIAEEVDIITLLPEEKRSEIDPALKEYLKLKVRINMTHEPSLDFLANTKPNDPVRMRIFLSLRVMITLWDGLEIPLSGKLCTVVACKVAQIPVKNSNLEPKPDEALTKLIENIKPELLDPGAYMLLLDFSQCDVETFTLFWQQKQLKGVEVKLDKLVETLIKSYFKNKGMGFAVGLPSFGEYLPTLPKTDDNRLFGQLAAIRVLDNDTLALAFNLLNYTGGNFDSLYNFAKNCSLGFVLPEKSIMKVMEFAWDRLIKGKQLVASATYESGTINEVINAIGKVVDIVQRIAIEIQTMGFVESNSTWHGLKFDLGLTVNFPNMPKIDLMPGNKVRLHDAVVEAYFSLRVSLDVEYSVEIDPTGWFPDIIPDIELYSDRRYFDIFNMRLHLTEVGLNEGVGKIVFDTDKNSLALSLESLDLAFDAALSLFPGCPFLEFPHELQELLLNLAEQAIVKNCPKINVSPPLSVKTSLLPWPLEIKGKKLEIDAEEITATLDAWFEPLKQDIPYVPKYIVNTNNNEIHQIGCDGLLDTYEEHKRGYHLLNDALNRGYDGCGRCLPAFNNRT